MSFQEDPYRTLGVVPGASLNEIKSAYRRLVKQYHPDAAGERALPRFLAIQAAYERLVDGEGRLRTVMGPPRGPASKPTEPWRADPTRARASRDAWRARRASGQTGPGAGAAGGFGWAKPGAGARRTTGDPAQGTPGGTSNGSAGAGGSTRRERPHREYHARRGPRKATPGSTSYDEAAELPLDPEWDGGAWYGPSSGTFWTLNPREYADPRKHGPEYQARAWRAAQAQAGLAADPEADVDGADVAQDPPRWGWKDGMADDPMAGDSTTTDTDVEWGTSAWHYDGVTAQPDAGDRRRADPTPPGSAAPGEATADLQTVVRRLSPRALLGLADRPDARWRLLLAFTGWPPIGWALGTLAAQLMACAPGSPTCAAPLQLLPLVVQPLVIVALFLVPAAAAVAAFASLVTLAVTLPVAAVLSLADAPDGSATSPVLGVIAAVAYLAALATGAIAVWQAPDDVGTGPPAP